MKTRSLRELCLKVNTAPEDFFSEDMRDIGKKYIESRLTIFVDKIVQVIDFATHKLDTWRPNFSVILWMR